MRKTEGKCEGGEKDKKIYSDCQEKSICYGGKILTMMCLAVAAGNASPPGSKKPEEFAINPFDLVEKGLETARGMVERVIDMMKTSAEDIPVILVGGGSSILDTSKVHVKKGKGMFL